MQDSQAANTGNCWQLTRWTLHVPVVWPQVAMGQVAITDVPETIRQKIMYLLNPAVLEHAPVRGGTAGAGPPYI